MIIIYKKKVSIILVCKNEINHIENTLNSLLNQSYDNKEILVCDGLSTDGTQKKILELSKNNPDIFLFENKKIFTSNGLNLGIENSSGEYIFIAGAHTEYNNFYIEKCIEFLENNLSVACVGGIAKCYPKNNTIYEKSFADLYSSPFGIGNAKYRFEKSEEKVDTVAYGIYRKEVFEKYGLFNENLIRNQDIEFNYRLNKNGENIFLIPIENKYFAPSTIKKFLKKNFGNGLWVIKSSKYSEKAFSLRHLIPLFFVLFLIFGTVFSLFFKPVLYGFMFILGFYTALNILFSFRLALRRKCFLCFFLNIIGFAVLHMSYGFGSLFSLINYFK